MIELQDGGRCMSGLDAIDFFEQLADVIDEEVRDEEFCSQFTWAVNRVRYEVRKSVPCPVRKQTGKFTAYNCGQCGRGVVAWDSFCPGCGRKIAW